ncbi:unnamed protein product [Medioppia subpectinata]|uniref:acetyl-CoA C-acetyltransferase n=1 Tax=Medioppia subpectinata TaxID=1979941 RepID=A0A7R9KPQ5_9ACAR|nr:unnamed protein product [Medioppia subpectinata]CAG2107499.1 unnamed protein product [Medioppia subpectinata]
MGSVAIRAAIERAGIAPENVDEVIVGHVLSAGNGHLTSIQAAIEAGLPASTASTGINKACASGMKAIMLSATSIRVGDNDVVVAGGMESMSNTPYLLPRGELPYGGATLKDGILVDDLDDPFSGKHAGYLADKEAVKQGITRAAQDKYAANSYRRSARAADEGLTAKEIVPVTVAGKRGKPGVTVIDDEEYKKINIDRMPSLAPVFVKDGTGTVTAANASTLNDGAAAAVLMSGAAVRKFGVRPLAKVIAYADAAVEPEGFTRAPALAIPKVLAKAGLDKSEIAHWEINEAFSNVPLLCIKLLGLDPERVNPNGGAVSLGHPLGCSGARIVNHLALHLKPNEYGLAAICNGGGGASAILIQKL